MVATITISFGGFLIEIALFQVLKLEEKRKIISYFLLILSAICYIILWFERFSDPKLQIILFGLGNLFISSSYCSISTSQVTEECCYDQKKISVAFLSCHLSRNAVNIIFMLVIGFEMKKYKYSFWDIILINVFLVILIETIRTFFIKKPDIKKGVF